MYPVHFAMAQPKPVLKAPKFGMVEIPDLKHDKAEGLFEAGVNLAKARKTEKAIRYLKESFEVDDNFSRRLKIATLFATGIPSKHEPDPRQGNYKVDPANYEPLLKADPQLADEMLTRMLGQSSVSYSSYVSDSDKRGAVRLYTDHLAKLNPTYHKKALDLELQYAGQGNSFGSSLRFLETMVKLDALKEAKTALKDIFEKKAYGGYATSQLQDQLSVVKLLAGFPIEPEVARNGAVYQDPKQIPIYESLSVLADAKLAQSLLKKLALQTPHPELHQPTARKIRNEVLGLLMDGGGSLKPDQETAIQVVEKACAAASKAAQ